MDIRVKFALVASVAVASTLGGRLWLGAAEQERAMAQRESSYLEEATALGVQRLDGWHAKSQAAVKTLAKIPGLVKMDQERGQRELMALINPLPWADIAFATDAKGVQILRTQQNLALSVGDRPYYKAAMEKGLGRLVTISMATGRPAYLTAARLAPATGAEGGGVGVLVLHLDKISEAVVGVEEGKGGHKREERRFIVMEDGKLLAHSSAKALAAGKQGALADASKHPLWKERPRAGQFALASYADEGGRRWVGAMRQSELGWYVAVEAPEDSFAAEELAGRGELGALGVATLLAAALGALAGAAARRKGAWAGALGMGVAVGLAVGAFCAHQAAQAKQRGRADAGVFLAQSAARGAGKIEDWIEGNQASLQTLAAAPGFAEKALSREAEDRVWALGRIAVAISELPWVRHGYVADAEGAQVLRSDDGTRVPVGDRSFFKQAAAEPFGIQLLTARAGGAPSLIMARALRGAGGEFMGVAAFSVQASAIFDQLSVAPVGRSGMRFILDKAGGLVAHSSKDEAQLAAGEPTSYAEHALWKGRPQGSGVSEMAFEWKGKTYMGAVAKANDFYAASALPMEEIDEQASDLAVSGLLFALFCLAVSAALGWSISPERQAGAAQG